MGRLGKPTPLSRLREFLELSGERWNARLTPDMGWFRRRGLFLVRVARLVARGFRVGNRDLHASALTFFTLLSIVPLLALGLALAEAFGGGDMARRKISGEIVLLGQRLAGGADSELAGEFAGKLAAFGDGVFARIDAINFSTLGGVGLALLFWTGVSMLSQVERSFNSVWGAPPRTLWRKCSDYLTIIVVVPFLALAASTLSIVPRVTRFLTGCAPFPVDANWLARLVQVSATALLTVAVFAVMFLFVPNTKVRFKAGLSGAVLTALCFCLWLKACAALQAGVVRYGKIYGGFAALPILMVWVYYSWRIVLFGAEFSFAVQNSETFFRDERARSASFRARVRTALVLVAEMARRMAGKEEPLSVAGYSAEHGLSTRLALDVLDGLAEAGLVVRADDAGPVYLLARSPEALSAAEVAGAVANRGASPEDLGLGKDGAAAAGYLLPAEKAFAERLGVPVSRLSHTE